MSVSFHVYIGLGNKNVWVQNLLGQETVKVWLKPSYSVNTFHCKTTLKWALCVSF